MGCYHIERLEFFGQIVREVGVQFIRSKPMHQDQPGCFSTGEEQEGFGLVNVVTPLGKTRRERCAIDAVAGYHNHVTNPDAPLLDRSGSCLLCRSLNSGWILEHETFLSG